ncbi:hypothetical protein [Pedomonas mirosovicensis]|uniref:hypothetical protein n=1 Tax=Pedomonas mirosovicensis TaxID=2908641 RepID=UPI00216A4288|nr:hypothetical protein [Pedomonas mirosovicensis]MCH8684813.1 hypothetical protein [Pedomonas mirosovicensis]
MDQSLHNVKRHRGWMFPWAAWWSAGERNFILAGQENGTNMEHKSLKNALI